MPQASARGSWSPNARLTGPRTPRTSAGSPGSGEPGRHAEVAPDEQLHPDDQEHDAQQADGEHASQS